MNADNVRTTNRVLIENLRLRVEAAIEGLILDGADLAQAMKDIDSAVKAFAHDAKDNMVIGWWKTLNVEFGPAEVEGAGQ